MTQANTSAPAGQVLDLAGEVASLRRELATLRTEIDSVRRDRAVAAPDPAQEALRRQTAAWDLALGLTPEVRQRRATQTARHRSLEDAGVRLLSQNAGKVWLFLALLTVLAVAFRDKLA